MADTTDPMKSKKVILIAILIVIVVAAVSVAAYYFLAPQTPESVVVTNFSDGAWANYTSEFYQDGVFVSEGRLLVWANAGTYNGEDCWIYVENETHTLEGGIVQSNIQTFTIDKTTFMGLHQKNEIYENGVNTYSKEFSPAEEGFNDQLLLFKSMTVQATNQSIIVPAGVFNTTELKDTSIFSVNGATYDITAWINPDVPCWGVVKYQYCQDGALDTICLLESYGS